MDISSVNSDLIRGNVTTIILGCLKDDDKYGYEILKEIEDKSHSQYALKQATLYNQLKRLEKQGLVSSYDGAPDDTGGGKRRYYALTPEGRNYLLKEKGEYEYARTILDKLVSDSEFDFTKDIPFDASELRPYSKRESSSDDTQKVVYKEKIVEVEKPVEVEKRIYIDRFGNPLSEEEYERALTQATLDDEQARKTEEELAAALAKLREIEDAQAKYEEELKLAEQARLDKEEELRNVSASEREKEEQLRIAEEHRINSEVQLHQVEQERTSTEEQLREAEEQLRLSKEQYAEIEEQLRQLEQERSSTEEQLYVSEIQRAAVEEELRRLQEERAEEEERRRIEQSRPSTTVDELFAKLDAQSEYHYPVARPTQIYANVPETENIYLEQPADAQENAQPQATLQDLFRQMDEKAAEIEAERLRQQAEELRRQQEEFERQQQELAADALAYEREYAQSELDTYA
ncbi:MAG: helix-turn-helix transcriptional regulator, partial [Bacteroides sp.]|nr:helix-turn-helix transcriptional regulator [Bacteroides sp.]